VKIVVLVKQVPDTYGERVLDPATGWVDRVGSDAVIDEINERALELALSYRDAHKGTEVVVMSMGAAAVTVGLRKGLAMGADSAVHILDGALAGADAGWTSTVLAAALTKTGFDLVIAGNESTDGAGGVVPAMVAERLSLPHMTYLESVEISDDQVAGVRGTGQAKLRVHASLPAVISVTEGLPEARFPNFKGIMSAKKKPFAVTTLADLGIDPSITFAGTGRSVVVQTTQRPARAAGTKIVDSGNAGVELADFLAAAHLI